MRYGWLGGLLTTGKLNEPNTASAWRSLLSRGARREVKPCILCCHTGATNIGHSKERLSFPRNSTPTILSSVHRLPIFLETKLELLVHLLWQPRVHFTYFTQVPLGLV